MKTNKLFGLTLLMSSLMISACNGATSTPKSSKTPDPQPSSNVQVSSSDAQPSSSAQTTSSSQPKSYSAQTTSSSQPKSSSTQPSSSKQDQTTSQTPTSSSAQPSSQDESDYGMDITPYLLPHAEGTAANYIFEAECTDLRGKSGSGYSGGATGSGLATHNAEDIAFVTFLYTEGISVNFFVASDRDVTDAKLRARFGGEFIHVLLSPDNYTIRVDQAIDPAYLTDYDPKDLDSEGCLGNWDSFFLDYYGVDETDGYYLNEWECESIDIDASNQSDVIGWQTFDITFSLSLKKGVNCISLITDNDEITGDAPHGTMTATAPVIDYISIETTAQLGAFNAKNNGEGDNAVHFLGK